MGLTSLLLAASLMGPPEPVEPELMHHFSNQRDRNSNVLAIQIPLQVLGAGFDLWTTQRCLNMGTCYETNPLGSPDEAPYVVKGLSLLATVGLTVWAEKSDKRWLGWVITVLSVGYQSFIAVRNLRF